MVSAAVAAQGTLLKIGDGGGTEVFTTIKDAYNISGPTTTVETTDVTSHDSSAWREFIPTLIDPGEVTFSFFYSGHATQDQLRTDMLARTRRNFQLVFAPLLVDETIAFTGIVTGYQPQEPHDGALSVDVTVKVTAAWAWS
jgi:hypothetical protein